MSQIQREEIKSANITVLRIKGQFIGGEETDELRATLTSLSDIPSSSVIVDMEHVSYLNSTALGVFISANNLFAKNGGKIALCSVGKSIENIFIITKLTLVFTIYNTLDEAIQQFS
jgi:anti-sigma B factor antagonist